MTAARSGSRGPGRAEVLRVDPASLDFGRVPLQPDFRWKLAIKNTSDKPITIKKFRTSCTCTGVTPDTLALGPSEERTVELALNLSRADTPGQGVLPGDLDFSVSVAPVDDSAEQPLASWMVHGKVVKSLDISDPELLFGDVLRVETSAPRTVRLAAQGEIARLVATCESKEVALAVGDRTSSGGRDLRVSIKSSPDLGGRDALIRLEGEAADGFPLRGYVKARWNVVGDVAIAPSSLVDGARRRGDVFRSRVVLASRTDAKIRVASFASDSPSVKIREVDRRDGHDPEFEIETTIDAVGEVRHAAHFDVILGNSESNRDRVTLPILGFGLGDPETPQGR